MTRNQIEYWNMKESGRHNVATEGETERHNRATEGIDISKLTESQRHNLETERQGSIDVATRRMSQQEAVRHNIVSEGQGAVDLNIKAGQLAETQRHNTATEAYQGTQAYSQSRLNNATADLRSIETDWADLQHATDLAVSQSTQREIDAKIRQVNANIEKLNSETQQGQQNVDYRLYNEILRGVDSLSQMIRAIKGGKK